MTLEAKVTAVADDPNNANTALVTVQVYDTDAPAVILFTGALSARYDWPPERLLDALDALFDRVETRRQSLAWMQNFVGKTRRRRP
jgi:hypothetical protein